MKKSILPLLMLLPALAANGFEAYFYSGNGTTPVHVEKNAVAISFLDGKSCVRNTGHSTIELDNSQFDHMLFRQKGGTTALVTPEISGIRFEVGGSVLRVESAMRLTKVTVYSTSGVAVAEGVVGGYAAELNLENLAPGMYVVGVCSETETATFKFINK